MLVNVLNTEIVNGKPVYYIDVSAKYSSHFNKLYLVSDKYRVYCQPFELYDDIYEDWDIEILCEHLNQEISSAVIRKILNND